eukprot:TRINITY_DN65780_c0_g1_i1.p1 TRINITY_DN65780_c0_g1~~TRINITY_DN65780_c0_g1_i1.p1  ORF type:complete len:730 (+),score=245.21 TRINITY_DN65780_c0_g1_i1:103-2190(+)
MAAIVGGTTPSPSCGGTAGMLPAERARASFDPALLRAVVRQGQEERIKEFRPLFAGPPFDGEGMDDFRSYEDLFRVRTERVAAAHRIVMNSPKFKAAHMALGSRKRVPMEAMFGAGHLMQVHFSMFLSYIHTQASDEQKRKWLMRAVQGRVIGAYAQTELGHGSNVRAIETVATYDQDADEFVIHSPTLSSLKWWPSGMYGCTHAIVFARLLLKGTDHGYHGFMVQLRRSDGTTMPGVEVGEIGPKLNGTNPNIGYARFTHVRVPRFNLFARNQQVTREGTYVAAPPKLSKFKYFTMMIIRMGFVRSSAQWLGKAATIVVRYSCVRRQGFRDSGDATSGENVIMDYRNQQYTAFKAVGLAYMFLWNADYITDFLRRVQAAVMAGDEAGARELPELHATCAGLKVASTIWGHNQIEECRRACGGQGFLIASGVADLTRSFGVMSTGEGAAQILNLQVARFLMKAVQAIRAGQPVAGTAAHLAGPDPSPLPAAGDLRGGAPDGLLRLLALRARRLAFKVERSFAAASARGLKFDAALNSVAIAAYRAADAHSAYIMARNQAAAIGQYVKDPAARAVLLTLHELTLLMLVTESAGELAGVLTEEAMDAAADRINELLQRLRPEAVALVDSFGFLDHELSSTLGRYDGNVYEAIYAAAKLSPLNRSDRMVGWEHVASMVDLKFLDAGAQEQRAGAQAKM